MGTGKVSRAVSSHWFGIDSIEESAMKTRSLELVSGNTVIKAEVTFDECHYPVRFDEFQTEDRIKTKNSDLAAIVAADVSQLLEEKLEMGYVELHEHGN